MSKYVEARVTNGILEVSFDSQNWFSTAIGCIAEQLKELPKTKNNNRVKQALKLKQAGFNGQEIIDIIGEIND